MKYLLTILSFVFVFEAMSQRKGDPEPLNEEARMKAEMALIDGERHLILENYAKALELFETAKDINPEDGAIHVKIA
ncbi:MAG: hypothetical protein RIF46_04675, partial [Cyclobacteriaceae bacterium]